VAVLYEESYKGLASSASVAVLYEESYKGLASSASVAVLYEESNKNHGVGRLLRGFV